MSLTFRERIFSHLTQSLRWACEDSLKRKLTYRDLGGRVQILREQLRSCPSGPVAILSHRKIETLIALLACLAEGRTILPLGAKRSSKELLAIMTSTHCRTMLFDREENLHSILTEFSGTMIELDLTPVSRPALEPFAPVLETDAFYLISTSGTTGTPKIVPISYKNYEAYFLNFERAFPAGPESRWAWAFELNFDPALGYSFSIFAMGGTLCPFSRGDQWTLEAYLKDLRIQHWASAPSVVSVLLDRVRNLKESTLESAHLMGEALGEPLAQKWRTLLPDLTIVNLYGPAECTVNTSASIDTPQKPAPRFENSLAIGNPFVSLSYALLGPEGLLEIKDGARGELLVQGPQVFSGYNDSGETPFYEDPNRGQFYRTGDQAVFKDKTYFFAGRLDTQIKVFGELVQLQLWEERIAASAHLDQVVLMGWPLRAGLFEGTALFLSQKDQTKLAEKFTSKESFARSLTETLPASLMPREIHWVPNWPLSSSGKTDRKAIAKLAQDLKTQLW